MMRKDRSVNPASGEQSTPAVPPVPAVPIVAADEARNIIVEQGKMGKAWEAALEAAGSAQALLERHGINKEVASRSDVRAAIEIPGLVFSDASRTPDLVTISRGRDGSPLYVTGTVLADGTSLSPERTDGGRSLWIVPFQRTAIDRALAEGTRLRLVERPIDALSSESLNANAIPTMAMLQPLALGSIDQHGYRSSLEQSLTFLLPQLRNVQTVEIVPEATAGTIGADRVATWLRARGIRAEVVSLRSLGVAAASFYEAIKPATSDPISIKSSEVHHGQRSGQPSVAAGDVRTATPAVRPEGDIHPTSGHVDGGAPVVPAPASAASVRGAPTGADPGSSVPGGGSASDGVVRRPGGEGDATRPGQDSGAGTGVASDQRGGHGAVSASNAGGQGGRTGGAGGSSGPGPAPVVSPIASVPPNPVAPSVAMSADPEALARTLELRPGAMAQVRMLCARDRMGDGNYANSTTFVGGPGSLDPVAMVATGDTYGQVGVGGGFCLQAVKTAHSDVVAWAITAEGGYGIVAAGFARPSAVDDAHRAIQSGGAEVQLIAAGFLPEIPESKKVGGKYVPALIPTLSAGTDVLCARVLPRNEQEKRAEILQRAFDTDRWGNNLTARFMTHEGVMRTALVAPDIQVYRIDGYRFESTGERRSVEIAAGFCTVNASDAAVVAIQTDAVSRTDVRPRFLDVLAQRGFINHPSYLPAPNNDGPVGASTVAAPTGSVKADVDETKAPRADQVNWRIAVDEEGVRGIKTRIRANLDAIEVLRNAEQEGRLLTDVERAKIASFSGWGAMPAMFSNGSFGEDDSRDWASRNAAFRELEPERARMKALLTPEEIAAAADSTINSHYTDYPIIRGAWEGVKRLGFEGGRLLEGSAGIGRFIGTMPDSIAAASKVSAVELDPMVGSMLKALYPQADVRVEPFQKFTMPAGYYDLAISNVPFSNTVIRQDKAYKTVGPVLHDYCILKAMDLVRPGGLGVFITSTGTMDKNDTRVRDKIAESCDLVAAMRFPEGTFKEAGTAVVTDILFLRKRMPGEAANGIGWSTAVDVAVPEGPARINEYYAANREQILGTLDMKSRLYARGEPHVSLTDDFDERWKAALSRLPENVYRGLAEQRSMGSGQNMNAPVAGAMGVRAGSFIVGQDGNVHRVQGDGSTIPLAERLAGEPLDVYRKRCDVIPLIGQMAGIRDSARALLRAQLNQEPTGVLRHTLNDQYDRFVKNNGPLHRPANIRAFRDDPDAAFVLGLESWDDVTKTGRKADLFQRDTIRTSAVASDPKTIEEAIGQSLNAIAAIDVRMIAYRLSLDEQTVEKLLRDKALAFVDPATRMWVEATEYLSGDVRKKLADARQVAAVDAGYRENVTALERVQPADVPFDEIDVKLGCPWVPASDIKQFCVAMVGGHPDHFDVRYLQASGDWIVELAGAGERHRHSAASTEIHGTKRAPFIECIEAAITGKPIVIRDKVDDASVVNEAETEAANAKVAELTEQFSDWVWQDGERRQRLHRYYNDTYNSIRLRSYDGSHLTFPGMLAEGADWDGKPFGGLRGHQKNAVWQGIVRGNACWGHEVGTGKTITMIATAMELRRLGLAKKPAIACLKANIGSITDDARRLYPGAKILSAYEEFDAENRKETVARIASGDWDLVILGHSQMAKIPVSADEQMSYIRERLHELNEAIRESVQYDINTDSDSDVSRAAKRNPSVKRMAKARERLKERMAGLLDTSKKDSTTTFEETGIDVLIVDEAHQFKSLPIISRMGQVKGLPTGESQAAANLEMIGTYLRRVNDGRGLYLATGTPVVNTLAEAYIVQRYVQPQELIDRNIMHFDAWARTFCSITTRMEFTHTGDYAPVARLRQFVNLPELQSMAFQDIDVVKADDVGEIRRPRRVDTPVLIPATSDTVQFMSELQQRAANLGSDKTKDNHLKIATDGRKAAVDIRLVWGNRIGDPTVEGKADAVAKKVAAIYHENPGRTQMVFSEITQADTGFHMVNYLTEKLGEMGVPRGKIVHFQGMSDKRRIAAIEALNEGEIAVAIGSTDTLGTGVNAQKNLLALHHIDAPWTPAEVEQRNGRGWRQGNLNPEIGIYTHMTEKSLDSWFWQTVGRKDRFIKSFLSRGKMERTIKEESVEDITYDKLMAISSGNPLLFERMNVENDIQSLERAQKRYYKAQDSIKESLYGLESRVVSDREMIAKEEADREAYRQVKNDKFNFTSKDGSVIGDKGEATAALVAAVADLSWRDEEMIGRLGPFAIMCIRSKFSNDSYHGEVRRVDSNGDVVGAAHDVNIGSLFGVGKEAPAEPDRVWTGISYALQSRIEADISRLKGRITADEQNINRLRDELGKPFKGHDEMIALRKVMSRIDRALSEGKTVIAPDDPDGEVA